MGDLLDALEASDGLPEFAGLIGWPLEPWQAEPFRLGQRFTVVAAPRQTGKSRCLALAAVWWALRSPAQVVLVVSASELGARRLLGEVRRVLGVGVLAGDVVEESAGLVVLVNGSRIVALPASERAVRGWSVDLLLVDEAAFVGDDLLEGALLPTVLARPDARVVLMSSPWTASGVFYRWWLAGDGGGDPGVRSWRWSVLDAPWVSAGEVERLRASMSPARFASEVLAEFAEGSAGFFSRRALLDATADYVLTAPEEADGGEVAFGLDWGRAVDFHALVAVGLCDDGGLNAYPPLVVPWLAASQQPYLAWARQVVAWSGRVPRGGVLSRPAVRVFEGGEIRYVSDKKPRRGGYDVARVVSETNGVGAAPTEFLVDALGGQRVVPVVTTQQHKERGFSRIASWLGEGLLVLPAVGRLLGELTSLEAVETQAGGLSIRASGAGHDDLAMAFCQAAWAVRPDALWGLRRSGRTVEAGDVVEAPNGLRVPKTPQPLTATGMAAWGRFVAE